MFEDQPSSNRRMPVGRSTITSAEYYEQIISDKDLEIKKYREILLKIAGMFYRDLKDTPDLDPKGLYTKILWGINDITK